MPAFTFVMNKVLFSRFLVFPTELFKADTPLFSAMHLTKSYSGNSLRYGFHLKAFGKKYSTNKMGLRLPEVNLSKDLILFSGDSTIFGSGINDEETVPYLIYKEFSAKYGVVNAGIPGKAIPHNLLTLKNFIKISKKQNTRVKYFVNWIHGADLEHEKTLDDIYNRATKTNLTWKQKLKVYFPFLAEIWWAIRIPGGLGGPPLGTTRLMFMEKRSYDFKVKSGDFKQYNERYLKQNEGYFNDIQKLCVENNIVLLNVVHAGEYEDIVSREGHSEYLERILNKNNAKIIIKTKDIYWRNPEVLPYVPREDNDFGHFSKHGASIIADHLISKIKNMDGG